MPRSRPRNRAEGIPTPRPLQQGGRGGEKDND
jgi:hypothetical protein